MEVPIDDMLSEFNPISHSNSIDFMDKFKATIFLRLLKCI